MFGFLRRKSERSSVWEAILGAGVQTASEIAVSPEIAFLCPPFRAGVAARIGTLVRSLLLYRRQDGGGKERATDHPLFKLIHERPNAWTSAPEFVMSLEKDTITHGAGYALANRAGDKIIELIRLPPSSVTEEFDPDTSEPRYRVSLQGGRQVTYGWRDVLKIPSLDGLSAIKQCREAIGLCLSMERHAARLFGSGARPSGVLKSKGKLSDAAYERLAKAWRSAHSGNNAGGTAILESDTEFQALTFSSVDLQFDSMRGFQVIEIARALSVPPSLLFDYSRATWANSEQMAQAFLTFTILPRMKLWRGAVARLLSAEDQEKYFAEFLTDELTKADIAQRFTAYASAITNGILNPNEVRELENRPPYENGDEFRRPMNTEAPGITGTPPAALPKLRAPA